MQKGRIKKGDIRKYIDENNIEEIIKLTSEDLNQKSTNGKSFGSGNNALIYAVYEKKHEIVGIIARKDGIDFCEDSLGYTPLHIVIQQLASDDEGGIGLVKTILDIYIAKNLNTDSKDSNGKTPLTIAVEKLIGQKEKVDRINHIKSQSIITSDIVPSNIENSSFYKTVQYMLEKSLSVDHEIKGKKILEHLMEISPELTIAGSYNSLERNEPNKKGETVLDVAINRYGPDSGTVREMTDGGYTPSAKKADTTLILAVKSGQSHLVDAATSVATDTAKNEALKINEKNRKKEIIQHRVKTIAYMVVGCLSAVALCYFILPLLKASIITEYFSYITAATAVFGTMVGCAIANIKLPEYDDFNPADGLNIGSMNIKLGSPQASSLVTPRGSRSNSLRSDMNA